MSEETTLLGVRVPVELKELVDADRRTNQEIVRAALWREFGGERRSALERRIEEKERRISMIETERNERERELEEMRSDLEALRDKLDGKEDFQTQIVEEAVETMSIHPDVGHDHLAAENWADKANLTPEEFWRRYTERWHEVADGDD